MQWLTQNWIWMISIIGVFLLLRPEQIGFGIGQAGHHGGSAEHEHTLPGALKDAMTGEVANAETALTSVYQERAYYFASRGNLERFEAASDQYAGGHGYRQHGC